LLASLLDNAEALALGGDIRETAALRIVETIPLLSKLPQVRFDGLVLVSRTLPEVRESTRRKVHGLLRLDVNGSSHRRDIGACGREDGQETSRVISVIGLARRTDTSVATAEDDRHATDTKLADNVAHLLCIGGRHALLILAVRCGEHLRKFVVGKSNEVGEEVQVWLIVIFVLARLVKIRYENATSGGAVEVGLDCWINQTCGILDIEVGLCAGARIVLVEKTT
jgi:hypothetical protein